VKSQHSAKFEVRTPVIAFLEGNSKIGLRQAVDQVPYYLLAISFELHAKMAQEIDLEKCNFPNFRSSLTLTLTLDRVEVIFLCICGRGLPTHMKLDQNRVDGWMEVRTDGQT